MPAEPVLTDADKTILRVLADAGRALTYTTIVQDADALVRKTGASAARKTGLIPLSETTLTQRIPLLEQWGLVSRPVGPGGKPTRHKGVGITQAGRKALAAPGPATPTA